MAENGGTYSPEPDQNRKEKQTQTTSGRAIPRRPPNDARYSRRITYRRILQNERIMKIFLIDPEYKRRLMVRSNDPDTLDRILDQCQNSGFVRVGRVRFWVHVITGLKRRFKNDSQ